jgi:hypothetical protein
MVEPLSEKVVAQIGKAEEYLDDKAKGMDPGKVRIVLE